MIALNCPICQTLIDKETDECMHQHHYENDKGVWQLLKPDFKIHLNNFLEKFEPIREQESAHPATGEHFQLLPYGPLSIRNHDWRFRQKTLEVLRDIIIPAPDSKIVEIGAWNGWLSHHLVNWGFELGAADFFTHPLDGLKAVEWYNEKWQCVQTDLRDPSFIGEKVDYIIFNHCIQFLPDREKLLKKYTEKLKPGGQIIILGLPVYQKTRKKENQVQKFRAYYRAEHLFNIFLFQTKGYVSMGDIKSLAHGGFKFYLYPNLKLQQWKARINRSAPLYYYGIFTKSQ